MKVRNAGSVLKNVFNGPCFHQMMFLCMKNVPGLPGCFSSCILQRQTSTTHSKFEIYPKMIVQRSCWCPWVLSTNYCLTFQIFQKRFTRQLHTNWQWDVYTSCILWKASFSQSSCVSCYLDFSGLETIALMSAEAPQLSAVFLGRLNGPHASSIWVVRKMFSRSGGQENGLGAASVRKNQRLHQTWRWIKHGFMLRDVIWVIFG